MTDADRAAVLRDTNTRLRAVVVDYLRSLNGDGVPGIALANVCHELQHPRVRRDGGCHCRHVRGG